MLDPFTIKPLDRNLILESARATKGRIVTVEDHYYEGNRPWVREGPQRAGCPSFIPPQGGSRDSASCWPQAWPGTRQAWLLGWLLGAPPTQGTQEDPDFA